MQPNPAYLLKSLSLTTPLLGCYDVADYQIFEPIVDTKKCIFSAYNDWLENKSICLSKGNCTCMGGKYWIGGVEFATREKFAHMLNTREGFKATSAIMEEWLAQQKPYEIENTYIVLSPLKEEQYNSLKTITFFVTPDQLSMLLLGAEYCNSNPISTPTKHFFGSGCCQLLAVFNDYPEDIPQAFIGATDIAMREHLPENILAFTVNKAMYKQLCDLDENSFLNKPFWKTLLAARKIS